MRNQPLEIKITKNYSAGSFPCLNQSSLEEESKVKKDVLIKEVLRDLKVKLRDNFHAVQVLSRNYKKWSSEEWI